MINAIVARWLSAIIVALGLGAAAVNDDPALPTAAEAQAEAQAAARVERIAAQAEAAR